MNPSEIQIPDGEGELVRIQDIYLHPNTPVIDYCCSVYIALHICTA
jgi:hypothetical protein